jgi:CYTH domain-containing protein
VRNRERRRLARVEARLFGRGRQVLDPRAYQGCCGSPVTIKAKGTGLRRLEVEYPISLIDGEALVSLRAIEPDRNGSPPGPLAPPHWEIDVFSGDNAGLILAEIELRDERGTFERPPWLGVEVKGQPRSYNSSLAQRPSVQGLRRIGEPEPEMWGRGAVGCPVAPVP